jgi:glycosyltransferase involved in cell wall biosynthesis
VSKDTDPSLYFEAPEAGASPTRRLLLVSCLFPPDPGVGSLRWQKLSRYAGQRGWGLDVITLDPRGLPHQSTDRLEELPAGTRVFTVPRPVVAFDKVALRVWTNARRLVTAGGEPNGSSTELGLPAVNGPVGRLRLRYLTKIDTMKTERFVRSAVNTARHVIRPGVHQWVISSGPPHMAHEAARLIAAEHGIPFAMDLRDPWCLAEVIPHDVDPKRWLLRAALDEKQCVEAARLVIMNTEPAAELMAARYPEVRDRIVAIRNGADDELLPNVAPSPQFTIAFAGTLYLGRNPRALFEAVARVVRELSLTPRDIAVKFMGSQSLGNLPLATLAAEAGIEALFSSEPTRPRQEALEFLAQASMLVNFHQDVHVSIPAKIYEYVRFHAWLLVLSPPGTATEQLLRGSGADVVAPDDVEAIAAAIRRRYQEFSRGARPQALNADRRFDRASQAAILFDVLEQNAERAR